MFSRLSTKGIPEYCTSLTGNALLRTDQLTVQFGQQPVLENINLSLKPGRIVTLIGPNGSGKSTLVKALIGAIKPTAGHIVRSRDLKIGYVPQRLHLDPTLPMTVHRFINLPKRHASRDIAEALEQAGAEHLLNAAMNHLSGGQLQRVLLARALLSRPSLLLLDEATQGLDHRGVAEFYQRIEQIRQRSQCAVLMVSHDLHVVMRTADHVICLNRHVCCEGQPEKVAASPQYHALFGDQAASTLAFYRHQHANPQDKEILRHAG
ncbi:MULTISPECIES: ATP-binding cassette domain-containing protein [Halomonadaceae]|uniref:ATP-binding cassette domain-containing protein n=2 Tax=Vreelandella TaxID=3137766 RepID=A0A7Z0LXB3_9GAMM|nr:MULTISPECIES: ATP-binding cassette domain-containing protein [Halomonas]NYS80314.1 ATP-binding cassette domain-containing protein [Halomonas glaciei]|tara:strand:- start:8996 stop:9787 length:792 start_codon:yes stop_codon:yes gene_type:complete